jgi:putative nucleotidyltransferase with HDIG domain
MKQELLTETTEEDKILLFLQNIIKNTEWYDKVYLAGGAVRDEIMGEKPKDLDFVIIGDIDAGINFATWLAKNLDIHKTNSNPVIYPRFGTAKLSLSGNKYNLVNTDLEFVAPRKEVYAPGNRKPKVSSGELKDDILRRDLTINSLVKNISTNQIIDLTGKGIDDIKNGIIRTTSDPTIIYKDDPLRMMRSVRFSVKYGFKIIPEVIENIKKNAGLIDSISKERIQDELNKILVSPSPAQGIELLRETNLLEHVLGSDFMKMIGMTQNKFHIDDAYNHTLKVLQGTPANLKTRLMALFHDIGKVNTRSTEENGDVHFYRHEEESMNLARKILTGLKYSNDIIDSVVKGVGAHMQLKHGEDSGDKLSNKSLRKFTASMGPDLHDILDLIHADNSSHSADASMPNQIGRVKERLSTLQPPEDKSQIKLPINGNDLIDMGLKPGPIFRQIMDAIQDAWFDDPDLTRETAINIAKQIMLDKNINEIKRIMKAQI